MRIFLELICLVDDLVHVLELSMLINASLPSIYYILLFDELDRGLGHEKQTNKQKTKTFC